MNEMLAFRRNALLADLCKEWNAKWTACHDNKEKLMELVLMQQSAPYFADFCYRGKGLSKEYCLREFGEYLNGRIFNDVEGSQGYTYAMFIESDDNVILDIDVSQFLWCNNIYINVKPCKCPTLYISNKSNVRVSCDGYNNVRVYLFDSSTLSVEDTDENSKVTVYKYSNDAKVQKGRFCLGEVKEFSKELRL